MKKENQKLHRAIEYWHNKTKKHTKKAILYFLLFFSILTTLGYTVDTITIKEEITNTELINYSIYLLLIIFTLYLAKRLLNIAMRNLHLKENNAGLQNRQEIQQFEDNLIRA